MKIKKISKNRLTKAQHKVNFDKASKTLRAKINHLLVIDTRIEVSLRASQIEIGKSLTALKVIAKANKQKWNLVMASFRMPYSSSYHYLACFANRNKKKAVKVPVEHTTFQKLQRNIKVAVGTYLTYAEEIGVSDAIAEKQAARIRASFVVGISIVKKAA